MSADDFAMQVMRDARGAMEETDPGVFRAMTDLENAAFTAGVLAGLPATLRRLGIKDGAALEKHLALDHPSTDPDG